MGKLPATEAKIVMVLGYIEEHPGLSLNKVSEAVGVPRSTINHWITNNAHDWNARYREALRRSFERLELPAIKALNELVNEKNFQAVKYVLDNRDYGATQKISADVKSDVNITISLDEGDDECQQ